MSERGVPRSYVWGAVSALLAALSVAITLSVKGCATSGEFSVVKHRSEQNEKRIETVEGKLDREIDHLEESMRTEVRRVETKIDEGQREQMKLIRSVARKLRIPVDEE